MGVKLTLCYKDNAHILLFLTEQGSAAISSWLETGDQKSMLLLYLHTGI